MAKDPISLRVYCTTAHRIARQTVSVLDLAAANAAKMVMVIWIPVEAGLRTAPQDSLNGTQLRKKVQVPIDRTQADLRQAPPHPFVQLGRCGMIPRALEFLEDDPPLERIALESAFDHKQLHITNEYYY